jgi:[ribosomal protein S5]-alanine N-acetyltransferase
MPKSYRLIATRRLDLYCLTAEELQSKDLSGLSFENPHGVYSGEDLPRTNRLADVQANPENIKWYYRMIVDRERNVAVGSVSFHAAPDERGMVEIGIGVAAPERGNGFASEALTGMWDWAATQPDVKFLRYTVSPDNLESIAIIRNFGFPQVGEQDDPKDGLELIFEASVEHYKDWL